MRPAATKTLSLKVPIELERRLERAARRRSAPKSDLMRRAIERYLDEEEPSPESFAARAADLAGSIEAAPDLSFHKKHLRGYGQ